MLFDALPTKGISRSHGTVVRPLWAWVSVHRESRRQLRIDIPQEIFLLKAEPEVIIVVIDGGPAVGYVRRTVGIQHLGHDQKGVLATGIGIDGHRLQQTIRTASVRLLCGTPIEGPHRALFQRASKVISHLGLTSQALGWLITIEPNVFKFRFHFEYVSGRCITVHSSLLRLVCRQCIPDALLCAEALRLSFSQEPCQHRRILNA